jgi:hypothetical protein
MAAPMKPLTNLSQNGGDILKLQHWPLFQAEQTPNVTNSSTAALTPRPLPHFAYQVYQTLIACQLHPNSASM